MLCNVKMSKTPNYNILIVFNNVACHVCATLLPFALHQPAQVPGKCYLYTWRINQKCIRIPLLYNKSKWFDRINLHSEYLISMINGHEKTNTKSRTSIQNKCNGRLLRLIQCIFLIHFLTPSINIIESHFFYYGII